MVDMMKNFATKKAYTHRSSSAEDQGHVAANISFKILTEQLATNTIKNGIVKKVKSGLMKSAYSKIQWD